MATFIDTETFSQGKNPPRNEDFVAYDDTTLVLSDGATDKTGLLFDGRTGGELAAELTVQTVMASKTNGTELVAEVTNALRDLYAKLNPEALHDSAYRFAATLVVARLTGDQLFITQVGDSPFRLNGKESYDNNAIIDGLMAGLRKKYIDATKDIEGARDYIMPLLKEQHRYQNNAESPIGYGVIDGTPVPDQFIKTYQFSTSAIHTVELVSDGYFDAFPELATIKAYEDLRQKIEAEDPNKCLNYPSTKQNDDRTVLIATIGK